MKLLFFLLFPVVLFSQIRTDLEVFQNSHGEVFSVANRTFKSYSGIDGSPYVDSSFEKIKIEGFDGSLPLLRYNAYEDEMEFMDVEGKLNYVVKAGEMRILFVKKNKLYALLNYEFEGKRSNGYLVEIAEKNEGVGLYKRERIEIVEYNNSTTNTYLKTKDPYFERQKDIYILRFGSDFVRVPKNMKEFKALLESKGIDKSDIDKVFKEKYNINKESDLLNLIRSINKHMVKTKSE